MYSHLLRFVPQGDQSLVRRVCDLYDLVRSPSQVRRHNSPDCSVLVRVIGDLHVSFSKFVTLSRPNPAVLGRHSMQALSNIGDN